MLTEYELERNNYYEEILLECRLYGLPEPQLFEYENSFVDYYNNDDIELYPDIRRKRNNKKPYKCNVKVFTKYSRKPLINALRKQKLGYYPGIAKKKALNLLIPIWIKNKVSKLDNCSICTNSLTNPLQYTCNHYFCRDCIY